MDELLNAMTEALADHWSKLVVGGALMGVGWVIGWWRARKKWQRKEFFERINFSLNSLAEGKLRIRTLMEKPSLEVFLNQVAVARLLEASQKTTANNPIIPLAKDDYWFYLNSVLNEVSEKFASGFIRRDIGQTTESNDYVICLTNEVDGAIRTRKIRAMLIRAADLESLPEEMPALESPNHETRWRTLQTMAHRYQETPEQFLRVELVV